MPEPGYKAPPWASEEAKLHFHADIIDNLRKAYLYLENVRTAEPSGWSNFLFEETVVKLQESIELLMHHAAMNMARTRPHEKQENKEEEQNGKDEEIAERQMSDA